MPKARVTIEDVARASDVSVATVSMVLSGKPGINATTRKRVAAIAQTMGYQRRIRVSEKPLRRVAILVDHGDAVDVISTGFVDRLVDGTKEIIEKLRMHCEVEVVDRTLFVDDEKADQAQSVYDGVIVVGIEPDREFNARLLDLGIPVVLVGMFADTMYTDAVQINHYHCMFDMTNHLISIGHKHIGLIGVTDSTIPNLRYRQHGFLHAMLDSGLDPSYSEPCGLDPADIKAATERLLDRYPAMTAIVCREDALAKIVLRVLAERNIAVPEQMSVTGFGDVTGSTNDDALTTIQFDGHTMGMLAINVMVNRLRVPAMMPVTAVLHAPVTIRATSAPPPQFAYENQPIDTADTSANWSDRPATDDR